MELARIYGIGFVVLRNTNSVGPGQFYAKQMVRLGMKWFYFELCLQSTHI
ncbi:unnamed protein product [Meloidogyne enterolobii]|uniref:Uncharacterized protein n=1 Tax=Meloidogyne enterolobii TaxID=390850 RepID=A0ACB0YFY2_MELEN